MVNETLKDGAKVQIRCLELADLDLLMDFFLKLPREVLRYLRIDVTKRDIVEERIRTAEMMNVSRIIALNEGDIVADGRLELSGDDWHKQNGEMRLIVAQDFQRRGLGMLMVRELYCIALEKNVKKVVAKLMRPQVGPRKMLRRLGFREELLIPGYVQDQDQKTQDLVIMTCDMKNFWGELEQFYLDSDWGRCR